MSRPRSAIIAITLCCLIVFAFASVVPALAEPGAAPASTTRHLLTTATCPVPNGQNFSGKNLSNHNFNADPPGSLVNANFSNADLTGAIFTSQDLTGASFQGANMGPSNNGPVDLTRTTLTNTCFIGATLNATDFTFARITCADFSDTSLMQARFGPSQMILTGKNCRTKFVSSTLDVNAITTDHWGQTDFTNANFQNVSPNTFNLVDKDITGALLAGAKFTGIDMTGANLTDVDFTGATLSNAKFDNAALNGVKLINAKLNYSSFTCARFYGKNSDGKSNPNTANCTTPESTDPYRAANLTQASLYAADMTSATLNSAILTAASFSGAILRGASFVSAMLEAQNNLNSASLLGADLTNTWFMTAHVNGVHFNNEIMPGARFDGSGTTMQNTDFSGSIMPSSNFAQATLQSVNFHNTILQSACFNGTTMQAVSGLSGVDFGCSQMGGSNLGNSKISAANFQAAVMPPGEQCCQQKVGDPWCGTVNATQLAYGPMIYPVLNSPVSCPNNENAKCTGDQWVIPDWRTNLCSSNHTYQTVWAPPNCGGSPGDNVHFNDPNLKACILATLPGQPTEVSVTTAAQIQAVSCPGKNIQDLTGLEKFTTLVSLDLTANQVAQYSLPLCTVQTLKLDDNQLTFLNVANSCQEPALVRLEASNNQLQSISGLGLLNYLQVLDVSHNKLSTFDLPIQTSLVFADLSYNNLIGVLDPYNSDLSRLTALSYLDLSHNSLPGIGSVKAMLTNSTGSPPGGALQSLFLACNPSFDCSSLQLPTSNNYPGVSTSRCAQYNPQSGQWITLTNPTCPPSAQAARSVSITKRLEKPGAELRGYAGPANKGVGGTLDACSTSQ